MATGKVCIDGNIVDSAEGRVPVLDRGFLYGDSVFEVYRTYGGVPFAEKEHLERLRMLGALTVYDDTKTQCLYRTWMRVFTHLTVVTGKGLQFEF